MTICNNCVNMKKKWNHPDTEYWNSEQQCMAKEVKRIPAISKFTGKVTHYTNKDKNGEYYHIFPLTRVINDGNCKYFVSKIQVKDEEYYIEKFYRLLNQNNIQGKNRQISEALFLKQVQEWYILLNNFSTTEKRRMICE